MAARKLIDLSPITMRGIYARIALVEQKQRELQALLDQKNLELQTLQAGLDQYIEIATGVNLTREDWTLDLDHAQLKRNTVRKQTSGQQHDDLSGGQAPEPCAQEHSVHESDDGVCESAHSGPRQGRKPRQ